MSQALFVSNVALWTCVVVLAAVVLALVRQIGLLHERIAPAGALMTGSGPAVGELAPVLEVTTLQGQPMTIGGDDEEDRATLLFFLSPTCPVCKTLLPTLLRVAADEATATTPVRVVLASDGERTEHETFVRERGLGALPYVLSPALGLSYRVGKLPYAVLLDRHGTVRARGLVNTREHLESLFEAERRGVASVQEYLRASRRGSSDENEEEAA